MARCNSKAKSGKQCRAKATSSGYCSIHEYPEKAAELSRKGVEARRKAAADIRTQADILPPTTPEELVHELAKTFADLKNGKMDVAVGRTLANVGHVVLKGFELVDIKKQLSELKELLNDRVSRSETGNESFQKSPVA